MIRQFLKARGGPEAELVAQYATFVARTLDPSNTLMLYEPRVGDAFPDLLILTWDQGIEVPCPAARLELRHEDVKITHLLSSSARGMSPDEITYLLGMTTGTVDRSLARIDAAGLLLTSSPQCRLDLSAAFKLTGIVAVEAKIDSPTRAVHQAVLNITFSSESYVLMPESPARRLSETLDEQRQVGLIAMNERTAEVLRASPTQRLPVSVFSWYLNEYVVRRLLLKQE